MAALDFPTNPTDQQQYTINGIVYYYNASVGAWLTVLTSKLSDTSSNTQVMFNDAGVSNGSYGLIFNKSSNTVVTANLYSTGIVGFGTNDPSYGGTVGSVFTINGNNKTGLAIAANTTQLAFALNPQVNGSWIMYDRASTGGTVWTAGLTQANGNVGIGAGATVSLDLSSRTDSIALPKGSSSQQPTAAIGNSGHIRFNTTTNRPETNLLGFWFDDTVSYTNIINKSKVVFTYTGGSQTWTIPSGVSYIFVKMWGAGGGGGSYGGWRQGSTGGGGGYSEGILPVVAGQTMTIRVGQQGYPRWGANKAYPDGGGASTAGGDNQYSGAGGGSTSIAVPNINSGTWCMFAGGGGGGGSVNGWARNPGGAGGGLVGEDAYSDGGQSYSAFVYVGKAGTQSAGGAAPTTYNTAGGAGSYNQGGTHQNGNCYGAGGGGGYYGGSSGVYYTSSMTGGGGGSGFIHSSIIRGITLTGNREYPPFPNDADLAAYSIGTSYRLSFGGDEAIMGGPGLVVIYY